MSDPSRNHYLEGPIPALFAKTAPPIIFVMGMNGLLNVADALFLGHYVGQDALAAVTLVFPLYMLIVACATLVAGGMSSLLARHLGARRLDLAQAVFAGAHWLAVTVALALIAAYLLVGGAVVRTAAGGDAMIAGMAGTYLRILVLWAPLYFVLAVNVDALRNEGHVGMMAAMSLLVSLANIGFDYVLIAVFHHGVAGSAYGTVAAQALGLALILAFRVRGRSALHPAAVLRRATARPWRAILALGAPQSLNFIGVALGSTAILSALQMAQSPDYAVTVSAYGIATRVMTFAILPLIGLSQAMQTITGNNHGAGLARRTGASLRFALGAALVFCLAVQLCVSLFAARIGAGFVADPAVVAKVAEILPVMVALFLFAGPLRMIATHFQAIGDAPRAALLSLAKPYLFAIPLTFALALGIGAGAIWWAGPASDALLAVLTVLVLARGARRQSLRWGVLPVAAAPVEGRA
ncbi:MATE family efflux transporter [Acidimangrovimonas pyrenivorans]|uniref:Multidrug export protein MepA n=1 Tax=Acidimangrovimonas pyrenivorans TaxID=2030798 RepID=A0ABV7ABZ4_9RHOB